MELIIGVIVVVIIIFIVKNNKKSAPKSSKFKKHQYERKSTIEQADHKELSMAKVSVSIQTTSYNVDVILADGESVSMVDLGYKSESGGYVNWSVYSVKGKNTTTNRMNTKRYKAKSRDSAIQLAKTDGLVEPFEITCLPHSCDPEKRRYFLEKLNAYGVIPPDGAVIDDLRDILDRVRYSDDIISEECNHNGNVVQYVRPIPGPNVELARYADDMGLNFSSYISAPSLLSQIVFTLSEREKTAFFAYCVLCNQKMDDIGDLRKTEFVDRLYEFADVALSNQDILKSIAGRNPDDYLKPHKGSKAYRAVADFFNL